MSGFRAPKHSFHIQYLSSATKMEITRKFTNNREPVFAAADYVELREFFENIVKAEQKFIGYQ
ncbi:hypothetical protein GCM10027051_31030 [Niabella terrae]